MSALPNIPPQAVAAFSALVVDDDEFVRGLVARQLRSLGQTQVATAGDAQSALSTLRSQHFDLVVCDLMMPGTDGVELVRDLGLARPGIAVILISSADPKLLRTAHQLAQRRAVRVLGTLCKPVQAVALRKLVELLAVQEPQPAARNISHSSDEVDEAAVREALRLDQFSIVVQPQVCLHTGQMTGTEALVRWNSPELGLVTPNRFLGVMERCGLLDQLTDRVLRRAIEAAGQWQQQGISARIAVNFAPQSLSAEALPERIAELARASAIPASRLIVEMTEQRVLQDLSDNLEVLTRLRLRDIELSIDDFGTGYSSLDRLQKIPFTELKIDRCFVIAAERDSDARRIVESCVQLAHHLGLRTIAEGVETASTLELMKALGVDIVQGYYFAKPMAVEQLPQWSRQHAAVSGCDHAPRCPRADQCKFLSHAH